MTKHLLFASSWKKFPFSTNSSAVVNERRLILLCDFSENFRDSLKSRLGDTDYIHCTLVNSQESNAWQGFERVVTRLLGELQRFLGGSNNGRCMVQVVCPSGQPFGYRGVLGMLRSAAQEDPRLSIQLIEVEGTPQAAQLAQLLQAGTKHRREHLRFSNDYVEVPHWEEVVNKKGVNSVSVPWKDNGVYLISGGAGGLGKLLAADIPHHALGVRLICCGRSAEADREFMALNGRNGALKLDYRQLDVIDTQSVTELIANLVREYGKLDGIIHAAGVLHDNYLIRKTHHELQQVLAPKIIGLVNLDEASRNLPLDFLLAFSSCAGALGNVGQADYAAANGFMDEYLEYRRGLVAMGQRSGNSVSIGWPLWFEGGMSVDESYLPEITSRFGQPLTKKTGLHLLYQAMASGKSHLLAIDPQGSAAAYLFEDIADNLVPKLNVSLSPAKSPDGLHQRVLLKLKQLLADTLKINIAQLDAEALLDSFGIDSLAVTRLNQRLSQWFGALPKTLFYQYPTLNALTDCLASQYLEGCQGWLSGSSSKAVKSKAADTIKTASKITKNPACEKREYKSTVEPIAIIGLSGRYPSAPDLETFWRNLSRGEDCIREIPSERWSLDGFFEADAQLAVEKSKSYSKWGAFLDNFALFDAAFFGISPREAAGMDPQERLFIETAWSVLESAGYTRQRLREQHDSRVGVFAGVTKTGFDKHQSVAAGGSVPRTSFGSLANRVSYLLDLHGPSMPIDTMCSASLTAIHEACEHLRSGACELAIAGGVNLYLHPSNYVDLCRFRMLSSDGYCRSFGEGGDGFVPGEGVGCVLLKPLAQAQADGDAIHAVILGSSINHGGRSNGYTVPNLQAQANVVCEALERSGISAADISYIEAHGTGTRLGDPVEIDGLTQAFSSHTQDRQFCAIGSVKSNIGHLEAAAGIAGLTKIVLQLQNKQLVPSLHATRLNPNIDFSVTPFRVQTQLAPWTQPDTIGQNNDYKPRVAGISSFGAGGANAHVIVAEYQATAPEVSRRDVGKPVLLPLSARNSEALLARVQQLNDWLDKQQTEPDLNAVAATLQMGREMMDERACFIARTASEWREQLNTFIASPETNERWWRGSVRVNREVTAQLQGDADLQRLQAHWIEQQAWSQLAAYWVKGMPINWRRLYDETVPALVHLPTYPFSGQRFWFEPQSQVLSTKPEPIQAPVLPKIENHLNASDIESILVGMLSDVLQMPENEINCSRSFADYGLDSILGVNLVHNLNENFDIRLETSILFDHSSVERLAKFIVQEYGNTFMLAAPNVTTKQIAPVSNSDSDKETIAVIGMAARYAGTQNTNELWQHLLAGHNLVEPVTRWELAKQAPASKCHAGSFVDGIEQFDPVFFEISGLEASHMDPQQRIFLEECWNALEDAGYVGERLQNRECGVYVGCYSGDYYELVGEQAPAQTLWGNMGSVVASRIAYYLDLKGPAISVDTSCSSSLVSLHLACQDLRSGTTDMALAGGVFIQNTPRLYQLAGRAGMLSSTGACHSFDKEADGFVPGEGAGVIVLKRLSDAQRDGDHIYGVIRGTGLNQDGTTNGITAPSAISQEQLLKKVYDDCGVKPRDIQLVETHGTGTPLGDPIEFRALNRTFAGVPKASCALGSVKTNLGHTQFAAGMTSVLKVLLSLQHRQIPPMLHFKSVNRDIALDGSPFYINTHACAWATPVNGVRRAAVSSFGASGTNAHVVIEESPLRSFEADRTQPLPYLLSARTPTALRQSVQRLLNHLQREEGIVADHVAYTLATGRKHFTHRLAVVAAGLPQLIKSLQNWLNGKADTLLYQGEVTVQAHADGIAKPMVAEAIAHAYITGRCNEFSSAFTANQRFCVPLPTYPFERARYWTSPNQPSVATLNSDSLRNNSKILSGNEFFLADHHVNGKAVLPGVMSLELAHSIAANHVATTGNFTSLSLHDVVWLETFVVETAGAKLQVELDRTTHEFSVQRVDIASGECRIHCKGKFSALTIDKPTAISLQSLHAQCQQSLLTREQCYRALQSVGIHHGERLQAIECLFVGEGEVLAQLQLPVSASDDHYVLHPSMLDSAVQAVLGLYADANGRLNSNPDQTMVPFAVDSVHIFATTTQTMWAHVRRVGNFASTNSQQTEKVDIDLYDNKGHLCVRLNGYTSRRITVASTATASKACLLVPLWNARSVIEKNKIEKSGWQDAYSSMYTKPVHTKQAVLVGGSAAEQVELRQYFPNLNTLVVHDQETIEQLAARLPNTAEHYIWLAPNKWDGDLLAMQQQGTLSAFRLIKALLCSGADVREINFTVVTRQARLLPGDTSVDPTHAGIHGLFGTLAKEYPHWRIRVVDIETSVAVPWDDVLSLPPDPRAEVQAWRRGEWYCQSLLELHGTEVEADLLLKPGNVVVAIGGAGGIGEVWTRHMMRRYGVRVVWIGRSPLNPDIEARRHALAADGLLPDYIQADATDLTALRQACDHIVSRYGPVYGVLHTAIVLGDQSLARMDETRFRSTYDTKVALSVNLAEVFASQPLQFFTFFSSMQSFFKAPGQANYAAGCVFADAFAEQLRLRLSCPVRVMNWGYWGSVGIVSSEDYRKRMAQSGLASIEPEEGMAAFDTLMSGQYPQLALLKANNTRSIDGLYDGDAIKILTHPAPSLIEKLHTRQPDRSYEIDQLRVRVNGHAKSMDHSLLQILWAQLQALGLFQDTQAANVTQWRERGGILEIYQRWMEHSLHVLAEAGYLHQQEDGFYAAVVVRRIDPETAWQAWDTACSNWLCDDAKRDQAVLVDTTIRSLGDILTGRCLATDVMFPRSSLKLVQNVYKNNLIADYFNQALADILIDYLRLRIEEDPSVKLRILEIGAGTGGTSSVIFRRLSEWKDHIETYCYTDISRAFLLHARKEYSDIAPYLNGQIFNVEQPLAGQSVEPGSYDVVVATNVLHATRNIRNSLQNAKALARKGALLLLNELSDNIVFNHLTFGLLEGWWLYNDPAVRIMGSPCLTPTSWQHILGELGWTQSFVAAKGADDLCQQVIVAESDGAVRQPRIEGNSAFCGQIADEVPIPKIESGLLHHAQHDEQHESQQAGKIAVRGEVHDEQIRERARNFFRQLVADTLCLSAEQIEADVPLERYGIDSILVVQLTDAVRKVLNNVGSTLFFEVKTIDGLVEHFLCTQPGALAKLVIPGLIMPEHTNIQPPSITRFPELCHMNNIKTGRPVFWIHSGNGGIGSYQPLAQRSQRPFYAIQPKGYIEGDILVGQEAKGIYYAAIIRSVQPKGPYDLGGYSLGGVLAYEVARQLQLQGEEVATLVMIDSLDGTTSNHASALSHCGRNKDEIAKVGLFRAVNTILMFSDVPLHGRDTSAMIHRDEIDTSLPYPELFDVLLATTYERSSNKNKAQLRERVIQLARYFEAVHDEHYEVLPLPRKDALRCYYLNNFSGIFFGPYEPFMVLYPRHDVSTVDGTYYWKEWSENIDDFYMIDIDLAIHNDLLTEPRSLKKVLRLCDTLYSA
ncbi:SDR family NAD(P)-dependent oxidoreductase [Xenorhabdus sp. PB62.4]|uniref:SDR family NAD(P)-dependent oxidoreductase n=1 Tax=Xenorhabdus sp. PB62.4 TaxID=1851573 RepID=UPI0016571657|nr:SDR family NAD(P)-dependent oxidoreductase [Xenorhabdus sp. PB62.4]